MSQAIVSVRQLCKRYGQTLAVNDVSFEVARGEIVGVVGPNGAGKTTTINLILGILEPTSGTISVNGMDSSRQRSAVRKQMNFSAVYAPLPGNLTVFENLYTFGLLYGVRDIGRRIEELLVRFDLVRFRGTKCGVLSSGEQTRVGLAKALLNEPLLLLLDEPTASLDPSVAKDIRDSILDFRAARQGAVVWTSHNMQEVATVCDRVLFLAHGSVLLAGDPRALPGQYGKDSLEELFISVARQPLSFQGDQV